MEGDKGYKVPMRSPDGAFDGRGVATLSDSILTACEQYREDAEFGSWWLSLEGSDTCDGVTRDDIADLLCIPLRGEDGHQWSTQERWHVAQVMMGLSLESMPERYSGQCFGYSLSRREERRLRRKGKRPTTKQAFTSERVPREDGALAQWLTRAIAHDILNPDKTKRLVEVSKAQASAFIQQHHSKLPYLNPRGLIGCLGLVVGERMVAVATIGTPSGRWNLEHRVNSGKLDIHNIVELTRVASDGTTRGASSMLVARLIGVMPCLCRGRGNDYLFVTYQLSSEEGTTYASLADKGLRPVSRTIGKKAGGTGVRKGSKDALCGADKIRWEAGTCPLDADWSLVGR